MPSRRGQGHGHGHGHRHGHGGKKPPGVANPAEVELEKPVTPEQYCAVLRHPRRLRHVCVADIGSSGRYDLIDALVFFAGVRMATVAGDVDTRVDSPDTSRSYRQVAAATWHEFDPRDNHTRVDAHVDGSSGARGRGSGAGAGAGADAGAGAGAGANTATLKQLGGLPATASAAPTKDAGAGTPPFSSLPAEGGGHIINLLSLPGNIDFSPASYAPVMHLCDGMLIVVDTLAGVAGLAPAMLWLASRWAVQPVLVFDNLASALIDVEVPSYDLYHVLCGHIDDANRALQQEPCPLRGGWPAPMSPTAGNVVFAGSKDCWGFTTRTFARMYAKVSGTPVSVWLKRLWGDHYFDPKTAKWTTAATSKHGRPFHHGFSVYVLDKVADMLRRVRDSPRKAAKRLKRMGVSVTAEDLDVPERALAGRVMRTWLPVVPVVLDAIVAHVPSPVEAQPYRASLAFPYHGHAGAAAGGGGDAAGNCDEADAAVLCVTKAVPQPGRSHHRPGARARVSMGRVFTGVVKPGARFHTYSDDPHGDQDAVVRGRVVVDRVLDIAALCTLERVPPGSLCLVGNVPTVVPARGVLTAAKLEPRFEGGGWTVRKEACCAVKVSITPVSAAHAAKVSEWVTRFADNDDHAFVVRGHRGLWLHGASEIHLEECVQELRRDWLPRDVEIGVGPIMVRYFETVRGTTPTPFVGKSSNHHVRVSMEAAPIARDIMDDLLEGRLQWGRATAGDAAHLARFAEVFPAIVGPTRADGTVKYRKRRLWKSSSLCLLADCTVETNVNELRDNIERSFPWTLCEGPLAGCPVQGVAFRLTHAVCHADIIHSGAGQIVPATRRAMCGAMQDAGVTLCEPHYSIDLVCPASCVERVCAGLTRIGGQVEVSPGRERIGHDRSHTGETGSIASRGAGSGAGAGAGSGGGSGEATASPVVGATTPLRVSISVRESLGLARQLKDWGEGEEVMITGQRVSHWANIPSEAGDETDATTLLGRVVYDMVKAHEFEPRVYSSGASASHPRPMPINAEGPEEL